jgi:hypothetical protein
MFFGDQIRQLVIAALEPRVRYPQFTWSGSSTLGLAVPSSHSRCRQGLLPTWPACGI